MSAYYFTTFKVLRHIFTNKNERKKENKERQNIRRSTAAKHARVLTIFRMRCKFVLCLMSLLNQFFSLSLLTTHANFHCICFRDMFSWLSIALMSSKWKAHKCNSPHSSFYFYLFGIHENGIFNDHGHKFHLLIDFICTFLRQSLIALRNQTRRIFHIESTIFYIAAHSNTDTRSSASAAFVFSLIVFYTMPCWRNGI